MFRFGKGKKDKEEPPSVSTNPVTQFVAARPMPSEEEVNAEFEKILEALAIPVAGRPTMRAQSTASKWMLIENFRQKQATSKPDETPEALLEAVKTSTMPGQVDVSVVHSLYMHLYSDTKDWVDAFFEANGLNVLTDALLGCLHSGLPNTQQIVFELLRCFKAASKSETWMNFFLKNGRCVKAITLAFALRDEASRNLVLELLVALCHLSDDGTMQVLAAWAEYQRQTGERLKFQALVQVLMAPEGEGKTVTDTSTAAEGSGGMVVGADGERRPSIASPSSRASVVVRPGPVTSSLHQKQLTLFLLLHLVNAEELMDRVVTRAELVACGLLQTMDSLKSRLNSKLSAHKAVASSTAAPTSEDQAVLLPAVTVDIIAGIEGNINGFVDMMNDDNTSALTQTGTMVRRVSVDLSSDAHDVVDVNVCVAVQLSDPHAVFESVLALAADSGHLGDLLRLLHHLLIMPNTVVTLSGNGDDGSRSLWPAVVAAVEHTLQASDENTDRGSFSTIGSVRPSFASTAAGGDSARIAEQAEEIVALKATVEQLKSASASTSTLQAEVNRLRSELDQSKAAREAAETAAEFAANKAIELHDAASQAGALQTALDTANKEIEALKIQLAAALAATSSTEVSIDSSAVEVSSPPRPLMPTPPMVARPGMPTPPRPGGEGGAVARPGMPTPPRPGSEGGPVARPGMPTPPRPGGESGPVARPGMPTPPRPGGESGSVARPGMPTPPRPGGEGGPVARPGMPTPPRPGGEGGPVARPGMPTPPRPGGEGARPAMPPGAPRPGMPTAPRPGVAAGAPRPGVGPRPSSAGAGGGAAEETSSVPKKPNTAPSKDMRPFYWSRLPDSAAANADLWKDLKESSARLDVKLGSLEALFAKGGGGAKMDATASSRALTAAAAKRGPVMIVDGKRQQNTGIMLGRLRLENDQLRRAIYAVDTTVLSPEKVKMVIDSLLPAAEEEAVKSYTGPLDELSKVDQYYFTLAQIPQVQQRLSAMLFKLKLHDSVEEARGKLRELNTGLTTIRSSSALRCLLEHVLALGNYLNGGTARGGAYGFKLDTLGKLESVKGSDNKTSLLDLLAKWAVNDIPSGPAAPMAQLPDIQSALENCKALSLKSVREDVESLVKQHGESLRVVTAHQTNCKDANDKFSAVLLPFFEASQKDLEDLKADVIAFKGKFEALVAQYGEDVGATDTDAFYTVFYNFAVSFKRAKASAEKEKAEEEKKKASAGPAAAATAAAPTKEAPTLPPIAGAGESDKNFVDSVIGSLAAAKGGLSAALVQRREHRRQASVVGLDVTPSQVSAALSGASSGSGSGGAGGSKLGPTPPVTQPKRGGFGGIALPGIGGALRK